MVNQASFENVQYIINIMSTIHESGILNLCPYATVINEEWLHYSLQSTLTTVEIVWPFSVLFTET